MLIVHRIYIHITKNICVWNILVPSKRQHVHLLRQIGAPTLWPNPLLIHSDPFDYIGLQNVTFEICYWWNSASFHWNRHSWHPHLFGSRRDEWQVFASQYCQTVCVMLIQNASQIYSRYHYATDIWYPKWIWRAIYIIHELSRNIPGNLGH